MKRPFYVSALSCAGCIAAGWIAAFAMPPVSFWPCLFAGLPALYWFYARTQSAGGAFATGFFFALGYFVTGLWWIGNALLIEGNEFAWVWPISVIGLPTLLALFTGTYLAIARMTARPGTWAGFFAFAFFLTFSEWSRGNAFTGFPWNLYGYVWADYLPMAQMTHYIGAYALTLLSVAWAALGGFLIVSRGDIRIKAMAAGLVLFTMAGAYALGQTRLDTSDTLFDRSTGIVVVQPNIAQNMKWDPVAVQDNFLKISSLSRGATFAVPPENIFIVWPETAISPSVYGVEDNVARMRAMLESYTDSNAYLVTGILRRMENKDGEPAFGNSVLFADKTLSPLAFYEKTHLVPFGEFIPLQDWIPLRPVAAFRGFERGSGAATLAASTAPAFSPLVCYEVIFPDDVVDKNGPRPQWIVNVTNDGWYGDSAGPYQHYAQTRLRAIEEGIPVVRAANTGISAVIDPYGRVVDHAGISEEAILVTHLPRALPPKNPYWPWMFQVLLPLAALFLMGRLVFFVSRASYT